MKTRLLILNKSNLNFIKFRAWRFLFLVHSIESDNRFSFDKFSFLGEKKITFITFNVQVRAVVLR